MRILTLAGVALALAGCAAKRPAPTINVPTPESGRVSVRATAAAPVGQVQPIAVAVTNGQATTLRLDPRQVYASADGTERVAPLTPGEAAEQSGGKRAPGTVKRAAKGVAGGGVLGAIGGAVSGAIWGSAGIGAAAGAAGGAAVGLVTSFFTGGSEPQIDATEYQDRGLQGTTLGPDFSATGYVYFPAGTYQTLELLLTEEGSGTVVQERVAIAPAE
jgi:hypothetical protein